MGTMYPGRNIAMSDATQLSTVIVSLQRLLDSFLLTLCVAVPSLSDRVVVFWR